MNCVDYLFDNTRSLHKELVFGAQEKISYQTAYYNSQGIAKYLTKKIGQGNNILLISHNSPFFIIAYLGILKSGNVCIPLDPAIEQNNLNFILNKTKASIGFISSLTLKKLKISIELFSETNINSIISNEEDGGEITKEFDGNQIAEIIFTSGSTAIPKGVMITHNNIIANTESIIQYLELKEHDRVLVVMPFYYCYGLSLLHTHLRVGGQLVLNNNFIFLASTIKNLKDYECTGFAGVPSHFQILLRKTNLFRNSAFPSLRYVTQAGGKLHNVFIKEFTAAFPFIQFYTMYGQTEATARISYLPPQKLNDKLGSIGKGIPGVEIKVVDSKGKVVEPGKLGEIIVRGENIMAGYFDDPMESSKTIRNGWLYTGDLATIDNEGYVFIEARKKEIVKVGGKRVSLKEIEEVINTIPGVIDCTIEYVEDSILGEAIKATIITSDHINYINEDSILQFCGTKLSRHKIPSIIKIDKNLTISSTGKKIKGKFS